MASTDSLGISGWVEKFIIVWGLITAEKHARYTGWYGRAHDEVKVVAEDLGVDFWTACQVVSAISPSKNWNVNVKDGFHTIKAWQEFRSFEERVAYFKSFKVGAPVGWSNFRKAWSILDGDKEIVHKGSPKTWRFACNIFAPYETRLVTFDSHMARMWRGSTIGQAGGVRITPKQYLQGERDIQDFADLLGLTPEGVQEELWQEHLEMLATATFPNDLGLEW